jgi:hypothetical protein
MRLLWLLGGLAVALAAAPTALGATSALPSSGYMVFLDREGSALTQVRDKVTGRVVWSEAEQPGGGNEGDPCTDSHHSNLGASWKTFEPFVVNAATVPSKLRPSDAVADLVASARAWQSPFFTDCPNVPGVSSYRVVYGGTTTAHASLLGLAPDGENVVEFGSLAGTPCDVPDVLACTIVDYTKGQINEADMVFETDLQRTGFPGSWTTSDTTDGTQLAISDAATHEFGHFAGLDHAKNSPMLTMYPIVGDGAQTLGLGDMKGLLALY